MWCFCLVMVVKCLTGKLCPLYVLIGPAESWLDEARLTRTFCTWRASRCFRSTLTYRPMEDWMRVRTRSAQSFSSPPDEELPVPPQLRHSQCPLHRQSCWSGVPAKVHGWMVKTLMHRFARHVFMCVSKSGTGQRRLPRVGSY